MEKEPIKVSYFSAIVLAIVEVDVRRLTWLVIGLFFMALALLREFKVIMYGANFVHWADFLVVASVTAFYIYYLKLLGNEFVGEIQEAWDMMADEDNIPDDLGDHESESEHHIDMSTEMQGVEGSVVGLYNESGASAEEVIASLASVTGATLLHAGSNATRVERDGMEIQVVVKDLRAEATYEH